MENRKFDLVISEEATNMIETHINFLMQVSERGAEKLFIEIKESIKSLNEFPQRNAWFNSPMIPAYTYRKMLVNKRYLIIYEILENTVFIDYIIDCRQEYSWLTD
ncbi:MAG TPA: type II toxin-antitoxin system RelE/ParE family toxin [Ruminiclostridium sp.]